MLVQIPAPLEQRGLFRGGKLVELRGERRCGGGSRCLPRMNPGSSGCAQDEQTSQKGMTQADGS
jgi:hypothetical protein